MKKTLLRSLRDRSVVLPLTALTLVFSCGERMVWAAAPTDDERRHIEVLIGTYYRAVAEENVGQVVDLHHWNNSFERDKIAALTEQAFGVADSDFDRVRIQSIDLYPERGIGLVRVGVDYRVRSFDGTDAISGHLDAAIALVLGKRGWRIGKVGRAADLDLMAAASRFVDLSEEMETSVPPATVGQAATPSQVATLPKLSAAQGSGVPDASTGTGMTVAVATGSTTAAGLTFFAVRQKSTGQCVVVAGTEGISKGDTIFGAFPDFGQAYQTMTTKCAEGQPAPAPVTMPDRSGHPLTVDRLFEPDETVIRGRWGTIVRIATDPNTAGAREGGRVVEDGLYAPPGDDGPTEAVYRHDGSSVTLRGTATVVDCFGYCGRAGSVTFAIRGDGLELWSSGLVRHGDQGRAFEVDLGGVRELRLVTTDGGNGTGEDWAAWLDLQIGDAMPVPPAPVAAADTGGPNTGSTIVALPRYRANESTSGAFLINLSDGSAEFIDRVGIDGNSCRRRPMNLNVFTVLGRLNDRPAKTGEILVGEIRSTTGAVTGLFLVETSTGAAAYLDNLEHDPQRAIYRPVNGRPAAAIASSDGNFALVMRRDGAGGTDGAYLIHATTGQCIYFAHVDEMRPDPVVTFTTPLPKLAGRVVALPLQSGSEATPEALLIDESTGTLYKMSGLERDPTRFTVTTQSLGLFEFFPQSPSREASPRFLVVPGYSDNGAADAIFVVDAGTGRMAVLKGVRTGQEIRLVGSTKVLDLETTGVELAAVPKVGGSGTTDGAWVFSATGGCALVLENVRGPHGLKIRKISGSLN